MAAFGGVLTATQRERGRPGW